MDKKKTGTKIKVTDLPKKAVGVEEMKKVKGGSESIFQTISNRYRKTAEPHRLIHYDAEKKGQASK